MIAQIRFMETNWADDMLNEADPMIKPISSAHPTQPVADFTKTFVKRPLQAQPPSSIHDAIKLSSAAQAMAAALQEARETPAQTSKEAQSGDLQARRLLAKAAPPNRSPSK